MLIRRHRRPADHGGNIHVSQFLALGALLDHQRIPGEQRLQLLSGALRHSCVVLQRHVRPKAVQLPDGAFCLIAVQHTDTGGHTGIELVRNTAAVRVLGDLEIQQLTIAALSHRQRQDNGQDGMGVIALRVANVQLRAGKAPLEGAHQIKVGDIRRLRFLDKQQSQLRHRTSLLPVCWPRSRCSGYGSPVW